MAQLGTPALLPFALQEPLQFCCRGEKMLQAELGVADAASTCLLHCTFPRAVSNQCNSAPSAKDSVS